MNLVKGDDALVVEEIKKVIYRVAEEFGILVDRVILFGSRARGDYSGESDYDILIVTKERLNRKLRLRFIAEVHRRIVWLLDIPADIIVLDKRYFEKYRKVYGDIAGLASLEGITL